MVDIYVVGQKQKTIEEEIEFIHGCWGDESNIIFYRNCINNSSNSKDGIPEFYIARNVDGGKIVGCCALLRNDLISRQDLFPWLACLYVLKEYRKNKIGKELIDFTISRVKELGFSEIYLNTDHDSYYERYGWIFLDYGYIFNGHKSRIYKYKVDEINGL